MKTKRNLMTALVIALSCLVSFSAGAQSLEQREANAPEQIKRQLREMRLEIQRQKLNYTVGYTSASGRKNLIGGEADISIPRDYKISINRRSIEDLKKINIAREHYLRENPTMRNRLPELIRGQCLPHLQKFNWQDKGKVTPVKDQEDHPTCWAFAVTAAFESSYSIVNGEKINASEQFIIDGVRRDVRSQTPYPGAGWCGIGSMHDALDYYCDVGNVYDDSAPYACSDTPLGRSKTMPLPLKAVTWGYVACDPSNTGSCDMPTIQQIKKALCEHGPLVSKMLVPANSKFMDYSGGIFYENVSTCTNCVHDVLIVGWDDSLRNPQNPNQSQGAWRIKNSFGKLWGERGFAWIAYNSSKIGKDAAWLLAANKFYQDAGIWQLRESAPFLHQSPRPMPTSLTPAPLGLAPVGQ